MFKNRFFIFFILIISFLLFNNTLTSAQSTKHLNQFRQLYQELPTPNQYCTASGAPGPKYWQQQADYKMEVELDENKRRLFGTETITYFNNSPEPLDYLWLQLDQNIRARNSMAAKTNTGQISETMSFRYLERLQSNFDGGFKIEYVKDLKGRDLPYKIVETMMRVGLPSPLKPHANYSFKIKWWYNINDESKMGGRSGFDYYKKDGNCVFAIAQFFPRMAVYNETEGWQHKQFLGSGEFALPFGNYQVKITVPSDHIVGATGVLQNAQEVLTAEQIKRLEKALHSPDKTVLIVSQ
ncbi:MAG: M1 family peptidase, partial [Candidatus Aminicenantales bacterium]